MGTFVKSLLALDSLAYVARRGDEKKMEEMLVLDTSTTLKCNDCITQHIG